MCLEKKIITVNQCKRLRLPPNIDTQTIYFLSKIRKNPVKLRPIVLCTNGPTYTASAYVDSFLQPHMHRVRSYIKNSTDLIHILETLEVPNDTHLITSDIESLYTNVSHEQAITSVLKRLEGNPQKVLILDLLKYVLKNNVLKFNEHIFTQLHGIAMGTKLAPALASIYIGDLEESFLSSRKLQPTLWVRYIDEVFMIWPHALEEFDKFLKDLNSVRGEDTVHCGSKQPIVQFPRSNHL